MSKLIPDKIYIKDNSGIIFDGNYKARMFKKYNNDVKYIRADKIEEILRNIEVLLANIDGKDYRKKMSFDYGSEHAYSDCISKIKELLNEKD